MNEIDLINKITEEDIEFEPEHRYPLLTEGVHPIIFSEHNLRGLERIKHVNEIDLIREINLENLDTENNPSLVLYPQFKGFVPSQGGTYDLIPFNCRIKDFVYLGRHCRIVKGEQRFVYSRNPKNVKYNHGRGQVRIITEGWFRFPIRIDLYCSYKDHPNQEFIKNLFECFNDLRIEE